MNIVSISQNILLYILHAQHGYPGQRDDLRPAQDGDTARFHKAIQNGARFNAYKFFIVEIFHIIFSDYS